MASAPPPTAGPRPSPLDRLRRAFRVNLVGGAPLDQVVDDLFRSVLLRPADPESRAYYVGALRRGIPWARVVEAVHTSAEAVDNSRRMPLTTALGPSLLTRARDHGDEPAVYLCDLPGSGAAAALDRLATRAGDRLVLSGLSLDQLLWVPELVRRQASLLSGPWGRAALPLLAPGTFKAVVVAHPVARVARQLGALVAPDGERPGIEEALAGIPANLQARCLAAEIDVEGAWTRWAPEGGGQGGPPSLQGLLEQGGPGDPATAGTERDGGEAGLARRAVAALDSFDLVVPSEQAHRVAEAVGALWGAGTGRTGAPESPDDELPAPLARRVLAANQADLALYEAARDRAGSGAGPE